MFRQLSVIHTVLLLVLYCYNTNSILIADRTYREFVMKNRMFSQAHQSQSKSKSLELFAAALNTEVCYAVLT
ncbi:hypothetical protein CPAR01_02723 [Colletotrichum paranaense]|uniref:Secreted protein n=1 Tax=Colletotrichum paranaense TaxID=1914294 RepID=A0ABQ9T0B2_9PEZI|nr:uncharacterized protein CPAR01_02723 [Colletotrichum paranaense]KAI3537690.1 hypothetical protein CSPX01_10056 [Colletotrichum filicis]KAK1545221.1 hypothetical protein CPAR01_02723 [Colletotrichum paranaense]